MRPRSHRSVAELIDRQVFRWKEQAFARGDASEVPHEERLGPRFGPYLTISRDFGGGALAIAEDLGQRLGWTVYDRQLIEEVAESAHVRSAVIESLDEHARSWLDDYMATLPSMQGITEVTYIQHLIRVATTIARHGRAILVGRGANFFLPPEHGVRVRLVASFHDRARRVADTHRLSFDDAATRVRDEDLQRAQYVQHHFARNIADPSGYDLVLNLSEVPQQTVVGEVLDELDRKLGVRPRVTATGPAAGLGMTLPRTA
jgi:hypothetical protein